MTIFKKCYFSLFLFGIFSYSISANADYVLHSAFCTLDQGGLDLNEIHYPTHITKVTTDGVDFECAIPRLNVENTKLASQVDVYIKTSPNGPQLPEQYCKMRMNDEFADVHKFEYVYLDNNIQPGTFTVMTFTSAALDNVRAISDSAVFGLECFLPQYTSIYSIVITE